VNKCSKCGLECEAVFITLYDNDEFWGAPCKRPYTEEVSECCEAEVEEVEDNKH
jgi:hypothetical protein